MKPQDRILRLLGRSAISVTDNGDGFPAYVAQARNAGQDVNDWIEQNLGWVPARPVLESLVFPHLRPDSMVCELGVGTGRWSRHLAERLPSGRLLLVDQSPWIVKFLRHYFRDNPRVAVQICDGHSLPVVASAWADLIFSQGLFITLKLGHVMKYMEEFQRALKPEARAVFDFVDPETPEGWNFLRREYDRAAMTFSYHTLGSVVECCNAAGLQQEGVTSVGKSTYLVVRKTSR